MPLQLLSWLCGLLPVDWLFINNKFLSWDKIPTNFPAWGDICPCCSEEESENRKECTRRAQNRSTWRVWYHFNIIHSQYALIMLFIKGIESQLLCQFIGCLFEMWNCILSPGLQWKEQWQIQNWEVRGFLLLLRASPLKSFLWLVGHYVIAPPPQLRSSEDWIYMRRAMRSGMLLPWQL